MDNASLPSLLMIVSEKKKRLLHWCGSILAIIGVIFVGVRLHAYSIDLNFSRLTSFNWAGIAALSCAYGSANLLLALAWRQILSITGHPSSRFEAIKIYGRSQLAKYVPGNIFHLASRQVLGMANGMPAKALAKSITLELGLLFLSCIHFFWLTFPLWISNPPKSVGLVAFLISITFFSIYLNKKINRSALFAFLWQIGFFMASSIIFVFLLILTSEHENLAIQHYFAIGGTYIAAWLAGLLVPGAPAGVGVREFVLLFLLETIIKDVDLIMAILLSRVVTVNGDLLFFLISLTIPTKLAQKNK